MVYRSKPDGFFKGIMSIAMVITAAVTLLPIFLDKNIPLIALTETELFREVTKGPKN